MDWTVSGLGDLFFFFSSRRRHTRCSRDWSSDVCSSDLALRLAEVAAEERIDLSRSMVRRIIVAGEPGGSIPAVRTRIEALWNGARVVDHHGMTETGPVSYGCPARQDVLHVIESGFIAEVIDPDSGQAVAPGGRG